MTFASFASDLSGLTILILGVLGFVLALIFNKEFKGLLGRLTDFEWKQAKVRANPATDTAPSEPSQHNRDTEAAPPEEEDPHNPDEKSAPGGSASVDDDSEDAVRDAMFKAFFARDREEGEHRFKQLKGLVSDPVETKRDEVRRLAALFMGGLDEEALTSLRAMAKDPEIASFSRRMEGLCLSQAGQQSDAADAFEKAANAATTTGDRATALTLRAESLLAIGETSVAQSELEAAIRSDDDPMIQLGLWSGLAKVYEKAGLQALYAMALQKVAEISGNDPGKWFQAGYSYGSSESDGLAPLSLHCYRTSLRFDPERHWAINNLGAELSGLSLPVLAIDEYKRAASKGNTLAMANLAEKYLIAGFTEDAQRLINEAEKLADPDKKVATVAAKIREARDEQKKQYGELTAQGSRSASFFSNYAISRLQPAVDVALSGTWLLDSGADVLVDTSNSKLEATWKTGGPKSHRRFIGDLAGKTSQGTFEKESTWPYGDDSIHWENDGTGYLILTPDSMQLTMLRAKGTSVEYIRVSRNGAA